MEPVNSIVAFLYYTIWFFIGLQIKGRFHCVCNLASYSISTNKMFGSGELIYCLICWLRKVVLSQRSVFQESDEKFFYSFILFRIQVSSRRYG